LTLFRRFLAGGVVSVALVVSGVAGAHAAPPAPSSGPTAGGTTVTVDVPAGVTFTEITAGYLHSVGLGSDGNTYAWGFNAYGQLGNTSTTNSSVPVLVQTPPGVTFAKVTAGYYSSFAVGSDGNTYAWGHNGFGQLGNNSTRDSSVPVPVAAPPGVTFTEITAGYLHAVGLGSDGKTYAWGNNTHGQLGNNSTTNSSVPVPVAAPPGVTFTEITAGADHSLGLGSDGNAYAWGNNDFGQLGSNSTTNSSVPVPVAAPPGVTFTEITAGANYSLGLGSDGNTYAWGNNTYGQLGNNSTTNSLVPVLVRAPAVVVAGVTFGGVAGTNVVDNGDGTVTVVTPAHAAGPVDVVVEWTLTGVTQTPVPYTNGFTFTEVPTITDPADQTVTLGDTAVFTVTVTGYPEPTVAWEVSRDGGTTWESITVDTGATVSANGLEVSAATGATHHGYLYRAIATNSVGSAVSESALLTVTSNGGDTGGDGTGDITSISGTGGSSLPETGGAPHTAWIVAGVSALLLGGLLMTGAIRRKRIHP
jgi:LPXTG-motif cell wall-anchored protein